MRIFLITVFIGFHYVLFAQQDSLLSVADNLMYTQTDSAILIARQAWNKSLVTNSQEGLAGAEARLGLGHQLLGDFDSAKYYLYQSLDRWIELDNQFEIAQNKNTLGIVFDEQGRDDEAVANYVEALRIYESLDEKMGMAKVYNNLGIINKKNKQFDKVVDYYSKALEIYEELNHRFGIAATTGNIGSAMLETKEFERSIQYSNRAIAGYKEVGIDQYVPYSLENIGLAFRGLGNLTEAENYHRQALSHYEEYGNKKESAFTTCSIAEIKLELGSLDSAIYYAQKALVIAKEMEAMEEMQKAEKVLVMAHWLNSPLTSKLPYLDDFLEYSDSLNNTKRNEAIASIQTKYETEKKEQEILKLEAESKVKDLKIQQTTILIISVLILTVLAGVGVVLNFKRKNYKIRARHLEEKEKLQRNRFKAVIEAEEKERKRIAQELHDGLGQLLSAARLSISSLDEEEENPKVMNSVKLVDTAVSEVRTISHNLMPRALEQNGLVAALREQVRRINESEKLSVEMEGMEPNFDASFKAGLYRIIQEIVNNAIKYAECSKIKIEMIEKDQLFSLVISDDGKGFDTAGIEKSTGIGWRNVFSRVEVMNGKIDVKSGIGKGTKVKIDIPNGRYDQAAAG